MIQSSVAQNETTRTAQIFRGQFLSFGKLALCIIDLQERNNELSNLASAELVVRRSSQSCCPGISYSSRPLQKGFERSSALCKHSKGSRNLKTWSFPFGATRIPVPVRIIYQNAFSLHVFSSFLMKFPGYRPPCPYQSLSFVFAGGLEKTSWRHRDWRSSNGQCCLQTSTLWSRDGRENRNFAHSQCMVSHSEVPESSSQRYGYVRV